MRALRLNRALTIAITTLTVAMSFLLWFHVRNVSFARHVEAVTVGAAPNQTPPVEKMKIVPADVRGGPQWSPLTGDGSN